MGWENVVAGNGVGIAVTGMIVVAAGLVLMSGFIALLPRALAWANERAERGAARRKARREHREARKAGRGTANGGGGAPSGPAGAGGTAAASSSGTGLDGLAPELLVAIGFVLEAERGRDRAQDRQRITMRPDTEQTWTAIGKMRSLSTRL